MKWSLTRGQNQWKSLNRQTEIVWSQSLTGGGRLFTRGTNFKVFAYGRVRLARFALKTLTPRFTDFFTDFEKKKTDCFAVYWEEHFSHFLSEKDVLYGEKNVS